MCLFAGVLCIGFGMIPPAVILILVATLSMLSCIDANMPSHSRVITAIITGNPKHTAHAQELEQLPVAPPV